MSEIMNFDEYNANPKRKPCPFCGSDDISEISGISFDGELFYVITCNACNMQQRTIAKVGEYRGEHGMLAFERRSRELWDR